MRISASSSTSQSAIVRITPSGITTNLVPLRTSMIIRGSEQDLQLNSGLYSFDLDENQCNTYVVSVVVQMSPICEVLESFWVILVLILLADCVFVAVMERQRCLTTIENNLFLSFFRIHFHDWCRLSLRLNTLDDGDPMLWKWVSRAIIFRLHASFYHMSHWMRHSV